MSTQFAYGDNQYTSSSTSNFCHTYNILVLHHDTTWDKMCHANIQQVSKYFQKGTKICLQIWFIIILFLL